MPRKGLWSFVSILVAVSLVLGACGPRPTPTREATPVAVETPAGEPTPGLTPSPVVQVPEVEGEPVPTIIQRSPAAGAELALDGTVELVFNQPMDRAAVEAAFRIEPRVRGSFEWTDDQRVAFKPAAALPRAGQFEVTLDRTALAVSGAPLNDAYRFRFSTVGFLEVAQVLPEAGTRDVEPESTTTVIFNRPVVPLTTLNEQAGLPQPLTLDPPVAGKGEWVNTSIYLFMPDEPLVGGTTYTAKVAAGLSDTTGGILADAYEWSFTTQPPLVVWHQPYADQNLVPVTQGITITFNQPVEAGSAGAALTVRDGAGQRVPGLITVTEEVVEFTPEGRLAFDETYEATVAAGVLAIGGSVGMAEPFSWRFTTVPLPRIVRTEPADGDQAADPYTAFTLYLNAPIDASTVMPMLEMTPAITKTEVMTYYSQWNNSFTLDFGAQPSREYEVRIGPDIADPYGNTTGQSLTVRFATRALEPMVQLRVPDFVGTYNAYDPARLFVQHLNVSRLDLALYALTPERFFELQRQWNWDQLAIEAGEPVRKWRQPVENVLNKTQYTPIDLAEDGGALAPGLYFLTVRAPEVDVQRTWFGAWSHVLVVSEINLTIKRAEAQLLVWATDLQSGRPVENLTLDVRSEGVAPAETVTTAADGTALLTGISRSAGPLWLISASGESRFVMGSENWGRGVSPWDFGFGGGDWAQDTRAHIYTDRPIYRPDQTVFFRAIIKAEDDATYAPAGLTEAEVIIRDPNWEEVYNQRLPVSEYGALNGEYLLPAGAPLGDYQIEIRALGTSFGQSFQVAAYRPPQFEVLVTPSAEEILAGDAAQATVVVKTFFGSPVANAPVEWNALVERFNYIGLGTYSYSASDDPWGYRRWWWEGPISYHEPILSGSGTTDGQGRLILEIPAGTLAELVREEGSQSVTVEATAVGPDNSTIAGRSELVVHQGEFYIGVAPREYVTRAGDETLVDLITLDWEGQRQPGIALTAELYRREYENTFIENEIGGGTWEWQENDVLVETVTAVTDELGEATVAFIPPEGGTYRVLVSALDGGGRTVRSSAFFWATSPETISWRRDNNDRIMLVTDKVRYAPGETAEILIPSPFEGEQVALVTVERADVKRYEVIEMTSNSTVYRLPITAGYAPNIYVSAVLIKGQDASSKLADYRVGYAALEVETTQQELAVTLTPSTDRAEPGDTVQYELQVTDARGEPVQGEFSLDVVDKAVLTLQPRTANAILAAFYGPRALGVRTASGLAISVNRLVEQQMEEAGLDLAGKGADESLRSAADAAMPTATPAPTPMMEAPAEGVAQAQAVAGVEVRQEFADTAYWAPTIVTDGSGRATVTVELPDNLTTWTARAVGLTAETEVGEGTVEVVSTKPLLIRPVTPRFFVVDDRVQLAAIVNNNTDEPVAAEVTLDLVGLHLAEGEPATQQVTLQPQSEAKVTWWAVAEDVEYADLVFSAVGNGYSDASRPTLATGPEQTIPVYRYTAPEVVGTAGQLAEAGSRTEIVALPPQFDERQGELRLEIDPSLAAGMRAGLDYLEHFEYECTEQTVSRFLPNILTLRALRQLGVMDVDLETKLEEQVAIGLERLYLGQNGDGGWGWWKGNESNPYLTAYVLFALTKTAETGYDVRSDVTERAATYLAGQVVAPRELRSYREANRQAWLLFVLTEAGRDQAQALGDLYQNREKLSHYGRALLGMALGAADPRTATLLSDLSNAAILSATGAHWEESDYDYWAMNTDTRSTAIILDALTRLDPENAFIPNVVRWLMVARQEGIWETTQETAWALIALTDWMAYTGELAADYDWAAWLNDEEWVSGVATAENVDQPVVVTRALADLLREQGNVLTIGRGEGPGRLYYTAHLRAYLPVEAVEAANRGIIVSRQYYRADCEDGVQCEPVSEAKVGDEIRVKLTIIAPNSLYYLVVEDPLPAGAEAIDPTLATTSLLAEGPSLQDTRNWEVFWWGWWWNWYSHSEMRDEKVVLFADTLAAGTYEYTYTFRATLPGEFRVMPAFASEFYFPEVFGRTEGGLFTIGE